MSLSMVDRFGLQRFITAQDGVYAKVLAELKAGFKRTHWMWFIFPQAEGLGHSAMAQRYAIRSMDEAMAYLAHPLLGLRLIECTRAILEVREKCAYQIFGSPDDVKFRSSMTLFDVVGTSPLYRECLLRYFDGNSDERTINIIREWQRR